MYYRSFIGPLSININFPLVLAGSGCCAARQILSGRLLLFSLNDLPDQAEKTNLSSISFAFLLLALVILDLIPSLNSTLFIFLQASARLNEEKLFDGACIKVDLFSYVSITPGGGSGECAVGKV
jgi:hypothetical protein